MSYRILAPGRRSQDLAVQAAEAYLKRLGRYAKVEWIRLKEGGPQAEAQGMLLLLQPQEHVIALDEKGTQWTTQQLHDHLLALDRRGQGRIAWLIGGADGLAPAMRARAHSTLALSCLTLPHRVAQMLLVEQLYRVHTMMRGEQYHRA